MGNVVGVLVCLWCRGGCSVQKVSAHLTFFPPEPMYSFTENPETKELAFVLDSSLQLLPYSSTKAFKIRTKNRNEIAVLWYPVQGAEYTIIYSHGNATDLGGIHDGNLDLVNHLFGKAQIVAYDYSGYGESSGSPTEKQTYYDIEAVYDWTLTNVCQHNSKIVLYGQSVGSGPSCYLAARERIDGVILHSPILSGMRVLTENRLLGCLDIFPNIDRVPIIKCPVMIIHGKDDEDVPFNHGFRLHEAVNHRCQYPPWWVANAGHNDILQIQENLEEYHKRVYQFLLYLDTWNR